MTDDLPYPSYYEDQLTKQFYGDVFIMETYNSASVIEANTSATIADILVIETGGDGGDPDMPQSITFSFSAGDIADGRLIKTHNFNKSVVDVSVIDSNNKEVMVGLEILSPNAIALDFTRVQVNGIWKVLIEA